MSSIGGGTHGFSSDMPFPPCTHTAADPLSGAWFVVPKKEDFYAECGKFCMWRNDVWCVTFRHGSLSMRTVLIKMKEPRRQEGAPFTTRRRGRNIPSAFSTEAVTGKNSVFPGRAASVSLVPDRKEFFGNAENIFREEDHILPPRPVRAIRWNNVRRALPRPDGQTSCLWRPRASA